MDRPLLDSLISQLQVNTYFATGDLFKELEKCYRECSPVVGNKYPIRKTSKHRKYNRLTTTYNKNHYNKFYVPVWAADYDYVQRAGYVLYPPELKPLTLVLEEIAGKFDKLVEVVRLCFAPVAFAVDALHESTNRRSGYYHRDICVDNVYLPWKYFNGEPKYGEAKLMLTSNTRLVYDPDVFDQQTSREAKPRAYFRFPEEGNSYEKKFDWYSFGVYIFEVMRIALIENGTKSKSWRKAVQETDTVEGSFILFQRLHYDLMQKLDENKQLGDEKVEALKSCLDIAVRCININPAEGEYEEKRLAEWPDTDTPPEESLSQVYCLEHKVNAYTAKLFALYRQIGDYLGKYHVFFYDARVQDAHPKTCDACLLRSPDDLPLKTYWKGAVRRRNSNGSSKFVPSRRCIDDGCSKLYCSSCYKNGERLFCHIHHAPASPIIGPNCYALVLYGNNFYKGDTTEQHAYKYDACRLVNTLMHLEVRGIPYGNIVKKPLYDKKEKRSGEELLKEACDEMYTRIHLQGVAGASECTNSSDYHLIIYYSGHGKGGPEDDDEEDGSWAPMATQLSKGKWRKDWISHLKIQEYTQSIRGFRDKTHPKVGCSNSNCYGSCTDVTWIMDHCQTSKDAPNVCKKVGEENPRSWVVTASGSPKHHSPKDEFQEPYSEIIYLICEILRSKNMDYSARMVSIVNPSSVPVRAVCDSIPERMIQKKGNYPPKISIFSERSLPDDRDGLYIALAYENPGGIAHRALSIKDGKPFPISSSWETCDHKTITNKVLNVFNKERKKNTKREAEAVTLLSSATNDHSQYSLLFDLEVQSCLDATSRVKDNRLCANAVLYFAAVYDKVKVSLLAADIGLSEDIELNLEVKDIPHSLDLTHDIALERPNILVHVVHHFYLLWKESKEPIEERLAQLVNNFAGHLFKERKKLNLFKEDKGAESKWMELAHEAGCRRPSKRNVFEVDNLERQIIIRWPKDPREVVAMDTSLSFPEAEFSDYN